MKDGEPCSHPGCLNHVTHPCEGCGRTQGKEEQKPCNTCGKEIHCIENMLEPDGACWVDEKKREPNNG